MARKSAPPNCAGNSPPSSTRCTPRSTTPTAAADGKSGFPPVAVPGLLLLLRDTRSVGRPLGLRGTLFVAKRVALRKEGQFSMKAPARCGRTGYPDFGKPQHGAR